MPEIKTNNYYFNMPAGYGAPQNSQYTGSIPTYMQPKERTVRDEFVYQHKKNGLFERLYNGIKNLTGWGTGSKKAKAAVEKAEAGEITEEQAKTTIDKYRKSQANGAQAFGDLLSVGAAGITFFGLKKGLLFEQAAAGLNKHFGRQSRFEILDKSSVKIRKMVKDAIVQYIAKHTKSKSKLTIIAAAGAATVGGLTKFFGLKFNRIGSNEFKTDKKDFNGAKAPYDKAAYKIEKKVKRNKRIKANFRNFVSGTINGLMMPVALLGNAIAGVPLYLAGNSLNRYFIGNHEEKNKSFKGYVDNLKNDSITHAALAAAIAVPMAKKGHYSAIYEKNLSKAFEAIKKNETLSQNPYNGKTAYQDLNDILFNDPKIRSIIRSEGEFENITIEDQIRKLTEENIFAVKFKQIESSYSPLSQALKDNCPATRTLEEAQQEVTRALGSGYTLKSNMGVGTVAETYLATSPNGKEVCIKMLKRGIDADKIIADKNKFIEIIKGLKEKSEAEKQYLIRNIEDLAEGILKEVDLQNEMKAAQELVKYTKTANVVKPIEVKNGVYVMEKAEGVSFKKLLEINNIENDIKMYERWIKDERNEVVKSYYGEKIEKLKKEKADINTKYGNILLSEKDINIMIDEYMKVLVEQLYKTDSKGRVLHADIHPGNIFIDVNALKNRKGKMFTLIDTGNTINLTADQAERSMKLTQYINRGDTKDIAKYFIEDADLSESGLTKAEATAKLEETLNKIFFSSDMELKTVNNTEIINLTSNIMKELNIMPGSSQLNLEKARTSAEQSFETLLTMWGNEAGNAIESSSSKVGMGVTAIRKLNQFMGKYNEYLELQKAQESRNLLQIIKSPKKFYQNLKNPNYKATNSEEYLIYHLKQRIRPKENNMFDFDLDDLI